jgi:hypothetical protein
MNKKIKPILTAAILAGVVAGAYAAPQPGAPATTPTDKDGCSSKNGCGGKNGCSGNSTAGGNTTTGGNTTAGK